MTDTNTLPLIFRNQALIAVIALSAACLLSACSVRAPGDPTPDSSVEGETVVRFDNPGISSYKAFYVEPVILLSHDSGSIHLASPMEQRELTAEFRSKVVRALADRATQSNLPAQNVAIIKISVTDVWSDHPLLNLRPGLIVPNKFRGGASMEATFYDSVSNKKLGYIYQTRRGARHGYFSGLGKWDGAKKAFAEWAELLAQKTRG